MNIQVQDDTAGAILGLWGTPCLSPAGTLADKDKDPANGSTKSTPLWKAGETVLLLKSPGWRIGRGTYLSLSTTTIVDVDPEMADADWLRRWASRQKIREAINPPFPEGVFDLQALMTSPLRCLYTFADLDEFSRAAPNETFQGYLSVLIMEIRLLENWKRGMLMCGECCSMPIYANSTTGTCKGCEKKVDLRLNPKILGQVIDETACVGPGKLLLSVHAWVDLLGCSPEGLLELGSEELRHIAEQLLFSRLTLLFGWNREAGGRICVMRISAG